MDDTAPPDYGSALHSLYSTVLSGAPGALQDASQGEQQALAAEHSANQSGLDFLRNYDNGRVNLPLLMAAGAMGAPTKTGSFSESLSNAFTAGGTALATQRQQELDRMEKMRAIQLADANLTRLQGQQKLQNLTRTMQMMGTLGSGQGLVADADYMAQRRGLVPGAGAVTPGRIAGAGLSTPDLPPPPAPPVAAPSAGPAGLPPPLDTSSPPPPSAVAMPGAGIPMPSSSGGVFAPPEMSRMPSPAPMAPPPQGQQVASAAPQSDAGPGGGFWPFGPEQGAPGAAPQPRQMAQAGPPAGGLPPQQAAMLNQAIRVFQAASANPMSPTARNDMANSLKLIEQLQPKGFAFDPRSQQLVPIGEQDPNFQFQKSYAERQGRQAGENTQKLTEIYNPQSNQMAVVPTDQALQIARQGMGLQTAESPQVKALVEGANEFRKQGAKYATLAPQVEDQLKELANIYRDYQSGRSNEAKAHFVSWAQGIPGLSSMLPANWAKDPAGFDTAMKTAQNMVLQKMIEGGVTRAPAAETRALSTTVPAPLNDPHANYQMVTKSLAANRYLRDFHQDYANSGQVDVDRFAQQWAKDHPYQTYVQQAQKEVAPFKGMQPNLPIRALRPPGSPQGSGSAQGAASSQQQPPAAGPVFARNPQTGHRIMSSDGGKTWQDAPQ